MSMGKRKRDIFTVREVVPNWLEASEGDNEYPEVGSEIYVEGHPGQVRANEVPVPKATSAEVHMDTPTGQGLANMFQFTQLPPAVTGWVSPGGRGVATSATTGSIPSSSSNLASEVTEWLEAAKAPSSEGTISPEAVPVEGPVEGDNPTLNAFWDLLQRARYETW